MNNLKNVISVERVPCSWLSGMYRVGLRGVKIPEGIEWEAISIRVPAKMSISNKVADGVEVFTASLSFMSCDDIPIIGRYCYRVGLADGTYRLLGTDMRPFPVLTANDNSPDNMTDSQLTEYNITYSSAHYIPIPI